jgi:hypothetical protein
MSLHCTTRFSVLLALHGIKIPCSQYDIEYDIVLFTATLFTSLTAMVTIGRELGFTGAFR